MKRARIIKLKTSNSVPDLRYKYIRTIPSLIDQKVKYRGAPLIIIKLYFMKSFIE